jgi:hypothetical protein
MPVLSRLSHSLEVGGELVDRSDEKEVNIITENTRTFSKAIKSPDKEDGASCPLMRCSNESGHQIWRGKGLLRSGCTEPTPKYDEA